MYSKCIFALIVKILHMKNTQIMGKFCKYGKNMFYFNIFWFRVHMRSLTFHIEKLLKKNGEIKAPLALNCIYEQCWRQYDMMTRDGKSIYKWHTVWLWWGILIVIGWFVSGISMRILSGQWLCFYFKNITNWYDNFI